MNHFSLFGWRTVGKAFARCHVRQPSNLEQAGRHGFRNSLSRVFLRHAGLHTAKAVVAGETTTTNQPETKNMLRRFALTALLGSICSLALATDLYPSRPIKLVVPFAPASSTDVLARLLADRLGQALGQPIIIDNRPGAGGMIGTAAGAKSPADGYTLTMAGSGPFGINPAIYAKLTYDPLKDFTPVINLVNTPQVMVTSANGPYKSLKQLMTETRASGSVLDFASIGPGSTSHMAGALFAKVSGLSMNHIAFKGNADAQLQVIGKTVPVMFDALPGVLNSIKGDKLRALAVASKERSPFAPDVPTFSELGMPTMVVTGWIGLAAPAGTSEAVLDRLNTELNKLLTEPEVREKLQGLAFTAVGGTRSEFGSYIRSEIAQWSQVARASGIQLE